MLPSKPRPPHLWSALFYGGLALAVAAQAQAAEVPIHPAVEGLTEVKSLDVTAEGGAIHALLVGHFSQRQGVAVAYVFSRDGGRTWSQPAFPAPAEAAPPVSRRGDDARLAVRSGRIMAVWKSRSELPGNGEIAVAVSADGGRTWRRGTNPAAGDTTRNQSHFGLAVDPAGDFHLVWLDDREENGNTQGLRYAKSSGDGLRWLPETTVDGNTCTCCWTRLLALPDRSLGLLFRDSNPHDMRFARLRTGQSTWATLSAVGRFDWEFAGCPHCGGGLAASGWAGRMVLHSVIWTGKEQTAGLYYLRSLDGGSHWSEPLRIAGEEARESDIAALADGTLGLAFVADRTQPVQFRSSQDEGRTWSAPKALSASGVVADHPRVVATPFGFRVFWTETHAGTGKTWAMAAPSV